MNSRPPNDGPPPPPPAPSPRDELEARLTALALGEAGEFEAATLRARIAAEPDLAALYRRIEAAALAFKNTFEDERTTATLPPLPEIPERLSAERRAVLEKLFATTEKSETATPTPEEQPAIFPWLRFDIFRHRPFVQILAAAACLALLVYFTVLFPTIGNVVTTAKKSASAQASHSLVQPAPAKDFEKDKSGIKEIADQNPAAEKSVETVLSTSLASNNATPSNSITPRMLSASELVNSVAQDNTPAAAPAGQSPANYSTENFGIGAPGLQPAEPPVAASAPAMSMSNSLSLYPDQFRVPNPPTSAPSVVTATTPVATPLAPPPPPPPPPPASLPYAGSGRGPRGGALAGGPGGAPGSFQGGGGFQGAGNGAGGGGFGGGGGAGGRGGFAGGAGGGGAGGRAPRGARRGAAGGAAPGSAAPASAVAPNDILVGSASSALPVGINLNAGTPLTLPPPSASLGSSTFSTALVGNGSVTILSETVDNTTGTAAPRTFLAGSNNFGSGSNTANAINSDLQLGSAPSAPAQNNDFNFAGTNALNMGDGAVTLNANRGVPVGNDAVTVAANTLTVSGVLSGGGNLSVTKIGTGTLSLNNVNTYTGNTTVSAGTLQLGNGTANGTGTGGSIVNNGALFYNEAGATTFSNVISGSGSVAQAGGNLSLNLGSLSRSSGGAVSVVGGNHAVSGVLDAGTFSNFGGDAGLRRDEGPAVAGGSDQAAASTRTAISLNEGNTFNGTVSVAGGNLALGNASVLQNNTLSTITNFDLAGGSLNYGKLSNATLGGLSGNQNLGSDNTSNVVLTVGQNNESTTYSGSLFGKGNVTLNNGNLSLNSAESVGSGHLEINGGTLNNNSAGAASGLTFNGGTLQYKGTGTTPGQTYILSGGTLEAGNPTGALSFFNTPSANNPGNVGMGGQGVVDNILVDDGAGKPSVTKAGTGTWTLAGTQSYTGVSTLQAGNTTDSRIYTGTLSGNGALNNVVGNGALTLNGTSTGASAGTVVTGGLINFNDVKNFGSGNVTLLGGGLQWASGTPTDVSEQINGKFGSLGGGLAAGNDTLDTNGSNLTLNNAVLGAARTSGLVKDGSGALTLQNGGGATTASGGTLSLPTIQRFDLTGAGLTKAGNGTLTLTGTNTYSGGTTLNAGTLQVGNSTVNLKRDSGQLLAGSDQMLSQSASGPAIMAGRGQPTAPGATVSTGLKKVADSTLAPTPSAAPAAAIAEIDAPASRPASEVKFPGPILTADSAYSTFSLNVSDTAFQLARAALQNRRWPEPASTRTEEFLNAFQYHDPAPGPGEAAALHYDLGQNPVESGGNLLRVSFQTAAAGRDRTTALHLTLLLDGSGSMTRADRVATLQAAVRALGTLLRPGDTASLVTFARTATVRLNAVPAERFAEIVNLIGTLQPDGGTNMEDALQTAYAIARANYDPTAQNRVILLTDGAANLGELEPQALAGIVETNRKAGIALDAYGVGWDGLDDTTLEALTRKSDGRYAFLNSPTDVNAAFANKLAGALTPAANDVKIQIEFNSQRVTSYRLMGYNNLRLTQQQFRDNAVNAGEMAAAEQGTALYNLVLNAQGSGPIGTARARYRDPGTTNYHELTWTIQYNGLPPAFDQTTPALRLATVAAYFAEYLQQSPYASGTNPRQLLELLRGVPEAFAPDTRPANLAEALTATASLAGN